VLYVFSDRVRFEAVASSDGAKHDFEYSSRELLEVKPDFWPIQRYKAFHIKTKSMVYNFVAPENDPSAEGWSW